MNQHKPKHSVAVIINDGFGLFEFGIVNEIFGLRRAEFDFPWYDLKVVSDSEGKVVSSNGIQISVALGLDYLEKVDTVVIPSWTSIKGQTPEVVQSIKLAAKRGVRFLSICSGVFLLAESGLLVNKKVTTHWKHINKLKEIYPELELQEDSLYIDNGSIICSAGSSAGIDASLHLVRRDFGTAVANEVARRLVAHPHRVGGQKQFIPKPVDIREKNTITDAMDWAIGQINSELSVKKMASHVHMSERTFYRKFKEISGRTPIEWLESERISIAKELLETTDTSLSRVAEKSGYLSIEAFRVAFKKVTGLSASAYRKNFKAPEI